MNQMYQVAIGLGSNLGDRLYSLRRASERLVKEFLEAAKSSPVYESEPWGKPDQPRFLNAILVGKTEWKPPAVLNYLKALEKELGRVPSERWGPRLIDLDVLTYGDVIWESETLVVPHRQLHEREFVLRPLVDLLPDWVHPRILQRPGEMLDSLLQKGSSTVRLYAPPLVVEPGLDSIEG